MRNHRNFPNTAARIPGVIAALVALAVASTALAAPPDSATAGIPGVVGASPDTAHAPRLHPAFAPAPANPLYGITRNPNLSLLEPPAPTTADPFTLTLRYPGSPIHSLLPPPREVQLTRFYRSALGADRVAYAGLALGYIGSQLGFFDEKNAWYLMGAGAALGAIWGGMSQPNDSGFQIRVRPDH